MPCNPALNVKAVIDKTVEDLQLDKGTLQSFASDGAKVMRKVWVRY